MPELPDVTVYVERLAALLVAQPIDAVRVASPFVVRTYEPPLSAAEGRSVCAVRRLGKRVVIELSDELFLVIHLMVAGRFHWRARGARLGRPRGLLAFDFPSGTLLLTEASQRKRASLHVVAGVAGLSDFDLGGIEPLEMTLEQFAAVMARENRTLKRALTDPRLVSGIGNAYSDEILHAAGLSPVALTQKLSNEETERLHRACQSTLSLWTERLRREVGDTFPERVSAFHDAMTVHGKFGRPCASCGTAVQRIRYRDNECNYCPRCQTGGRLLADRSLSRLLRKDWPRSIEELEERGVAGGRRPP